MDVINLRLIPAINAAGELFESGKFFLPQLMASAETVKLGFDAVKSAAEKGSVSSKGSIILATVKGDIHDIGKNIVKLLLNNYGYEVIDLGRDVPLEAVVREAKDRGVKLVGLSALMTTTVKAMEETVRALRGKVRQYVVSNGTVTAQSKKLCLSGLGALMDSIFLSEQLGAEKPSRAFFDAVFQSLGENCRHTSMIVGDSLTSDILGGMNAGIRTCWYNPDGLPAPEGYRIDEQICDLRQVIALVK